MSDVRRSVVMVAYHYPPEGSSSGVLRTLQFTRHLLGLGWAPHVLTLRRSLYAVRDETLESMVPQAATKASFTEGYGSHVDLEAPMARFFHSANTLDKLWPLADPPPRPLVRRLFERRWQRHLLHQLTGALEIVT